MGRYNPRKEKDFKRSGRTRPLKQSFLIVCNLYQGKIHRERYGEMLSKASGVAYNKREGFVTKFFQLLEPFQLKAIERAIKILADFNGLPPAKAESSTIVHVLVNELNKYR